MLARMLRFPAFFDGDADADRRFIDGIFNYCDRRCERCGLTDRCRLYADEQCDAQANAGGDWKDRVRRSFQQTSEMIQHWCTHEGIDVDDLRHDAQISAAVTAELKLSQEARRDPLQALAERYTFPAMRLARVLRESQGFANWPAEVGEALDTIEWFGIRVSSKIHRALTGFARDRNDGTLMRLGEDPVQSDWNGSAKVARLDIAESRAAWEVILRIGEAPADSPLRRMVGLLDGLDAAVAERFPQAMAFIRPGFDDQPTRAKS